ncbi:MAG: D-aminoacyl-tRNA deacylase [Halopseudomonas sp.]|uniref:D-aminoacyl-tRNA deacylase n=1 Tax=Halopseudomonas sp. TaxID=2901191 RepID=UPI003001C8CC
MKGLLQRVRQARVEVAGEVVGAIDQGLLVLVGIEPQDTEVSADKLLKRLLDYRVFTDADGRMNDSLRQVQGGLLLVSQFTLAADTRKGLRPGFSTAAPPAQAELLFNYLVSQAQALHAPVATGRFGADMQVHLVNDGPVTIMLET